MAENTVLGLSREMSKLPEQYGGVAERPNALVLKTSVAQVTGGSNPPASAIPPVVAGSRMRSLVPID